MEVSQLNSEKFSGLYNGFMGVSDDGDKWVELRIDVDGNNPLGIVSGDVFSDSGNRKYLYSFIFESIELINSKKELIIEGKAGKSSSCSDNHLKISVKIVKSHTPLVIANVQFSDPEGTNSFSLNKISEFFRTIVLENDYEEDVTPARSYDTGPPKGKLSLPKVFAEAGIELIINERAVNVITPSDRQSLYGWSDSELHAAMEKNFEDWSNNPQWKVWLFSAKKYASDPQIRGMMFDKIGRQRQGCATFFQFDPKDNYERRQQFFTYVHELSHCFNLLHPWDRAGAGKPAGIKEYSVLSWLNYPWLYCPEKAEIESAESNEDLFYRDFKFSFIDSELKHIRHGFRNDVICGGSPFGIGTASLSDSEENIDWFSAESKNDSGLNFLLKHTKLTFSYGEPVVVELKLSASKKSVIAHKCLHPKMGLVKLAIMGPLKGAVGKLRMYKPILRPLVSPTPKVIEPDYPIYESAYIGFGQDGFYFKEPGEYQIQALYRGFDSTIYSNNPLKIRVENKNMLSDKGRDVAKLLLEDDVGLLLYLKGSDSHLLNKAKQKIDSLISEYSDEELTTYARFVKGYNDARTFKAFNKEGKIESRKPNLEEAHELIDSVLTSSLKKGCGLDNISLEQTINHLAYAEKTLGFTDKTEFMLDRLVEVFNQRGVNPSIVNRFRYEKEKFIKNEKSELFFEK
jgi:hypothetical protein